MSGSMSRDAIAKTIKDKGEGGRVSAYCFSGGDLFSFIITKIRYSKRGKLSEAVLEKGLNRVSLKTDRRRNNAPWVITPSRKRVSRVE